MKTDDDDDDDDEIVLGKSSSPLDIFVTPIFSLLASDWLPPLTKIILRTDSDLMMITIHSVRVTSNEVDCCC